MLYISLRFCILYDTLLVMSVGARDVEPGISSVCFVVLLMDDTENGVDVLVCCCETKSTLMSSVRTQKKLLSDVRTLLRMIECLPIRFVQTSSRTFKTFCCWVCFIVDDSIECLLLIIWIVVYSYDVFVYSWIL